MLKQKSLNGKSSKQRFHIANEILVPTGVKLTKSTSPITSSSSALIVNAPSVNNTPMILMFRLDVITIGKIPE